MRHLHDTPLILVGKMWSDLVQWTRVHMLDPRLPVVNVEDLSIPRCVDTADDAIAVIREHHGRWRRAKGPEHPGGS